MTKDNDLVKKLRAAAKHPLMDNNCKADVFDVSDAADHIEALEAKLAKAVKDLEGWLEVSQHCTIEDGVCCCGEAMKGHANPMSCGHSPVDYGAYAAKRLAESTRATLAEIEGDKP